MRRNKSIVRWVPPVNHPMPTSQKGFALSHSSLSVPWLLVMWQHNCGSLWESAIKLKKNTFLVRGEISCCIKVFTENMWLGKKIKIGRLPGADICKPVFTQLGLWEDLMPPAWQSDKSRQVYSHYDQIFQMKISSWVELSMEGSKGRIFETGKRCWWNECKREDQGRKRWPMWQFGNQEWAAMQRTMAQTRVNCTLKNRKTLRLQPYELENKWEEVNSKGQKGARSFRDFRSQRVYNVRLLKGFKDEGWGVCWWHSRGRW